MVTIYQDYDDEPEDIFQPIPKDLAARFYALEMDNYIEDIAFFQQHIPREGAILELGCGTGRIAKKIAQEAGEGGQVMGLDISPAMLLLAKRNQPPGKTSVHFVCMDMIRMAFSIKFSAIIIPYNTLNLLCSEQNIIRCLRECRNLLEPGGKLLLQLFVPTPDFIHKKTSFQFQMFDRPEGGKIIKEILKHYQPHTQTVQVEERYRVRPMKPGCTNDDWNNLYTIAGYSANSWFALINRAGLNPTKIYSDYSGSSGYKQDSSILLASLTL